MRHLESLGEAPCPLVRHLVQVDGATKRYEYMAVVLLNHLDIGMVARKVDECLQNW